MGPPSGSCRAWTLGSLADSGEREELGASSYSSGPFPSFSEVTSVAYPQLEGPDSLQAASCAGLCPLGSGSPSPLPFGPRGGDHVSAAGPESRSCPRGSSALCPLILVDVTSTK